jgi:hypothetical protein
MEDNTQQRQFENGFTHHAPQPDQPSRYGANRAATLAFKEEKMVVWQTATPPPK